MMLEYAKIGVYIALGTVAMAGFIYYEALHLYDMLAWVAGLLGLR